MLFIGRTYIQSINIANKKNAIAIIDGAINNKFVL